MAVIQRWSLSQVWLYSLFVVSISQIQILLAKKYIDPKDTNLNNKNMLLKAFLPFLFWWNILTNRKNMFSFFFRETRFQPWNFSRKVLQRIAQKHELSKTYQTKSKKRNFQLPTFNFQLPRTSFHDAFLNVIMELLK